MDNALAQMLNALPQQADANGHHTPYQQQQQHMQMDMNALQTFSGVPAMSTGIEASHGLGTPLSLAAMVNEIQSQPTTSAKPPKPSGKKATSKGSGQHKTSGSKNKPLVGIAHDAHLKRLKRLAAESEEALRAAQAAHLVKLRKAAEAEAASRDTVRRAVASWVRGELGEAEAAVLSQWHDTLKQLLQQANKVELQEVQYYAHTINPDLNQLLASAAPVELRPPAVSNKQQAEAGTSKTEPAQASQVPDTAAEGEQPVQGAVTQTACDDIQTGTQRMCQEKSQEEEGNTAGTGNETLTPSPAITPDMDVTPTETMQPDQTQQPEKQQDADVALQADQHAEAAAANQQPTDTTAPMIVDEAVTPATAAQPVEQALASDTQLPPSTPLEQTAGGTIEHNQLPLGGTVQDAQERGPASTESKPDESSKVGRDLSNTTRPTSALQSELRTCHTWTYADPYTNQHGVRITMECLREIAALLPPVKALLTGDLIGTVQQFAQHHPHPAVSGLARHILGSWQRGVLSRLRALFSPGLLEDPVADLEARIANNQIQYPPDIVAKLAACQASNAQLTTPASQASSVAPTTPAFNTTSMPPPQQNGQTFAPGLDLSASLAAAANYNPLLMLGANKGEEASNAAMPGMPNMPANMFGGFTLPGATDPNLFNQWFAGNQQTAAGFPNTFPAPGQVPNQLDTMMMQGIQTNGNHVESMDILQQLAAFSGATSNQMMVDPHTFQNMTMANPTHSQGQQPASSFMTGVTEGGAPSTSVFATSMDTENQTPATQDATSKPEVVGPGAGA